MGTFERLFVGFFGAFLIGVGVFTLFFGVVSLTWRVLGCIVLCAAGTNAVHGALTGKRPWIAEIGSF